MDFEDGEGCKRLKEKGKAEAIKERWAEGKYRIMAIFSCYPWIFGRSRSLFLFPDFSISCPHESRLFRSCSRKMTFRNDA